MTLSVSTARILADRAQQATCGQQCVDWALAMLETGRDGQYLQRLAAMSPPYNHFEIATLRDHALDEQGIDQVIGDPAIVQYAKGLLGSALASGEGFENAVAEVARLCWTNGYIKELFSFYLLHFAYKDLHDYGNQSYWDGASMANIHSLMREHAERFVRAAI